MQSNLAAKNGLGVGNLLQVEQNAGGTPTGLSTNGSSADKRNTRKYIELVNLIASISYVLNVAVNPE